VVIRIGSNITSLAAQRRLAEGSEQLSSSLERLSSGLRINRASDDAAGLAIASTLEADSRVYTQAIRNVNDGVSALSIAEGSLKALSDIVVRQQELAEQAANGVYSATQRRALTAEANALVEEFNRIADTTTFNGRKLLDGNLNSLGIQAGVGTSGIITSNLGEELSRGTGDGTFAASYTLLTAGASLGDVLTADFNGDGLSDIIYSSYNSSTDVIVLLGNGNATFRAPITLVVANAGSALAIGDVNNDGRLDVMARDGAFVANVFLGNGNGTFLVRQTFANSGAFESTLGDVNGDGNLDIIASNYAQGVGILLGNGNGSFKATINVGTSASGIKRVETGDINGDGIVDIVAAGYGGDTLSVILGSKSNSFSVSQTISVGDKPRDVRLADIDFDGYLDLINLEQTSGNINVFKGSENGTFGAAKTYSTTMTVSGFTALADFNGDGLLDISLSRGGAGTSRVGILLGNRDGSFSAPTTYSSFDFTGDIATADFNSDGAIDIVARHVDASGTLSMFLGNARDVTFMPYLNLSSAQGAKNALVTLNQTRERISSELGSIGATQSRLGSAINTLSVARENFQAARSRIIDADIASESAELVRRTILQQAAAAVLSQANQEPLLALKLLG